MLTLLVLKLVPQALQCAQVLEISGNSILGGLPQFLLRKTLISAAAACLQRFCAVNVPRVLRTSWQQRISSRFERFERPPEFRAPDPISSTQHIPLDLDMKGISSTPEFLGSKSREQPRKESNQRPSFEHTSSTFRALRALRAGGPQRPRKPNKATRAASNEKSVPCEGSWPELSFGIVFSLQP